MTEKANDEVLPPAADYLMHIDEAVRNGATMKSLLVAAIAGEVELLFDIPAATNPMLLPLQNTSLNPLIGIPAFPRTPQYLVLEPRYCQALRYKASTLVRESKRGYRETSALSFLQRLDALDADKEKIWPVFIGGIESPPPEHDRRERWGSWGLQLNGAPFDHPVHRESLLLRASAFHRWMGWKIKKKPSRHYVPSSTELARADDEELFSTQLMRMCEAANEFWGGSKVIPGERDTYPSQEKVIDWLKCSSAGFSTESATAAARLLTPDWATVVGRRSKK